MSESPKIDLVDPLRYETEGQPHDLFRWLRRHDPVYRHAEPDGPGWWAVTRYRDVEAVSRDPATYSSALGGIMIADGSAEELAGARNMMLYIDPPRHVRYRKLVRSAFTPAAPSA